MYIIRGDVKTFITFYHVQDQYRVNFCCMLNNHRNLWPVNVNLTHMCVGWDVGPLCGGSELQMGCQSFLCGLD